MSLKVLFLIQMTVFLLLTLYQLWNLSLSIQHASAQAMNSPQQSFCNVSPKSSPTLTNTVIGRSDTPVDKSSFGACLIIQDDNHLLPEWLAYHYQILPLRRLIVGIDPRSETFPSAILNRYREKGLMKITEWYEEDMMPPHLLSAHRTVNSSDSEALKALYIERQIQFYTKCMATLHYENVTWAAMIDTDEYVLVNSMVRENFRLKHTENMTIHKILSDPSNRKENRMIKSGCFSMHRLQFGPKESNPAAVQSLVPHGFDGFHFSTMRWRYHAELTNQNVNKLAKCLVNLPLTRSTDFVSTEVSPHRPLKRLCDIGNMRKVNAESPLVVHHYSGSWESWNFRNDFRPKRQRQYFDLLRFDNENSQDDSIRPWLQEFVTNQGNELATFLLEGAGQLTGKTRPKVIHTL